MNYFKFLLSVGLLFLAPSILFCLDTKLTYSQEQDRVETMGSLSYDETFLLIEQIESGSLDDRENEEGLKRVNQFLVNLALPGRDDCALLIAIQNLLADSYQLYDSPSYSYQSSNYGFITAYFGLDRSSFTSGWQQTRSFVHDYKKVILFGAVIVSAEDVVVGAMRTSMQGELAPLRAVLEELIASFKEMVAKEGFAEFGAWSLVENGKTLASVFAHDCYSKLWMKMGFAELARSNLESFDLGHLEIDRKFATDYAYLFSDVDASPDLGTLLHRLR